jgi:hypothetical protein
VLSSFHLRCIIREASKDLLSKISFDFYVCFYHSNNGTVDYRVLSFMTDQEYRIIYNVHTILFLLWPTNLSSFFYELNTTCHVSQELGVLSFKTAEIGEGQS